MKKFENVYQTWADFKTEVKKLDKENDNLLFELTLNISELFYFQDKESNNLSNVYVTLAKIDLSENMKNITVYNSYPTEPRSFEHLHRDMFEALASKQYTTVFLLLFSVLAFHELSFEEIINETINQINN